MPGGVAVSDVLTFQRNARAANSADRAEHAYWLADKEEAETIFATIRGAMHLAYRGSSLSHVNQDVDGLSVHLSDEDAADDHLRTMFERWQDTLDPVSVERFNRFGWPEVLASKAGAQ